MSKTNIKQYIRIAVTKKIINGFVRVNCENCGSNQKLHVHHDDVMFTEMVNEAFELSNINYREYAKEYSEQELRMLVLLVIGMHHEVKYKVLCESCHNEVHSINNTNMTIARIKGIYKDRIPKMESQGFVVTNYISLVDDYNKFILCKVFDQYPNEYIFMPDEIRKLRLFLKDNLLSIRSANSRLTGLNVINKLLRNYNINCEINSFISWKSNFYRKTLWKLKKW